MPHVRIGRGSENGFPPSRLFHSSGQGSGICARTSFLQVECYRRPVCQFSFEPSCLTPSSSHVIPHLQLHAATGIPHGFALENIAIPCLDSSVEPWNH
jgi:hypothetical protein